MQPRIRCIVTACYIALTASMIYLIVSGHLELHRNSRGLLYDTGEAVGGDYIAFYTGASLLRESHDAAILYQFESQLNFQHSVIGEDASFLPFVYPPIVAIFFLPLSTLDFVSSYLSWFALSLFLYFLSAELLIRADKSWLRNHRALLFLGLASFTPLTIDTLGGGQLTAIGVTVVSSVYYFIRKDRFFFAGLVLSLAYYKAPLFAVLAMGLFLTQPKRLFWGALLGGSTLLGIEVFTFGHNVYHHYFHFLNEYWSGQSELLGRKIPSHLGVGLYSPLRDITPTAPYLIGALTALWLYVWYRKQTSSRAKFPWHFGELVIASAAFSLQVNNYDLALLAPCLLLWITHLRSGKGDAQQGTVGLIAFSALYHVGLVDEQIFLPCLFGGILLLQIVARRTNDKDGAQRI